MMRATPIQHGAILAPISNQVLLAAVTRVAIGVLLLGAMVVGWDRARYASTLDLQL